MDFLDSDSEPRGHYLKGIAHRSGVDGHISSALVFSLIKKDLSAEHIELVDGHELKDLDELVLWEILNLFGSDVVAKLEEDVGGAFLGSLIDIDSDRLIEPSM